MRAMTSPLAAPGPWDIVASAYAEELMPTFEFFSNQALELAALSEAVKVVDVAAGPGTLARLAAGRGHHVSAIDFSEKMIETLRARVERAGLEALVDARVGDGMALPYEEAAFDAGFSMFGLMFFPARDQGFRELLRVVKPDAPVVVASWLPFEHFELMAAAFGALNELAPPPPGTPPFKPPLAASEECLAEMTAAGFREVAVHDFAFEQTIPSVSEFWAMMVRTSAPVAFRKAKMGAAFDDLSQGVVERLRAKFGDGPQHARMPAHLTLGRR
jgi:SAM-dependent methyltransferase